LRHGGGSELPKVTESECRVSRYPMTLTSSCPAHSGTSLAMRQATCSQQAQEDSAESWATPNFNTRTASSRSRGREDVCDCFSMSSQGQRRGLSALMRHGGKSPFCSGKGQPGNLAQMSLCLSQSQTQPIYVSDRTSPKSHSRTMSGTPGKTRSGTQELCPPTSQGPAGGGQANGALHP
jgi:hypothetical protein